VFSKLPSAHSALLCTPNSTYYPPVVYVDVIDGVRWLRLESGKVQALDLELTTALTHEIVCAAAEGTPPLVVTGTGSSFSAGVDLFRVLRDGADYVARFLPALGQALTKLFTYEGPVVSAINGHAVAGGALLAWCGDLRVMADGNGRIGVPELRVGVPFPAAAVEILRFATGGRGVQALAYVGGTMTPHEALAASLVDEVVASGGLNDRAQALAATLASIPSASFRLTKRALRGPHMEALGREGAAVDDEVLRIWQAPETAAAIRAYLERTFGSRHR
jgi:enoyl-CoA hydratase